MGTFLGIIAIIILIRIFWKHPTITVAWTMLGLIVFLGISSLLLGFDIFYYSILNTFMFWFGITLFIVGVLTLGLIIKFFYTILKSKQFS